MSGWTRNAANMSAHGRHEPRVLLGDPFGRIRLMIWSMRIRMHIWAVIEVIVNVAGNGAVCERLMMAVRTEGISSNGVHELLFT